MLLERQHAHVRPCHPLQGIHRRPAAGLPAAWSASANGSVAVQAVFFSITRPNFRKFDEAEKTAEGLLALEMEPESSQGVGVGVAAFVEGAPGGGDKHARFLACFVVFGVGAYCQFAEAIECRLDLKVSMVRERSFKGCKTLDMAGQSVETTGCNLNGESMSCIEVVGLVSRWSVDVLVSSVAFDGQSFIPPIEIKRL